MPPPDMARSRRRTSDVGPLSFPDMARSHRRTSDVGPLSFPDMARSRRRSSDIGTLPLFGPGRSGRRSSDVGALSMTRRSVSLDVNRLPSVSQLRQEDREWKANMELGRSFTELEQFNANRLPRNISPISEDDVEEDCSDWLASEEFRAFLLKSRDKKQKRQREYDQWLEQFRERKDRAMERILKLWENKNEDIGRLEDQLQRYCPFPNPENRKLSIRDVIKRLTTDRDIAKRMNNPSAYWGQWHLHVFQLKNTISVASVWYDINMISASINSASH